MAIHANVILDENPQSAELISWVHLFWPHIQGSQISLQFVDGLMHHSVSEIFDAELLQNHAYSYAELFSLIIRKRELNQELFFNQAIHLLIENRYKTEVYAEPEAIQNWIENSKFHDLTIIDRTLLNQRTAIRKEIILDYLLYSHPPILFLSLQPHSFSRIILTFDGSLHSTQSIKKFIRNFSFLLPHTPLILMTILRAESLPQEKPIIDYIKSYQPNFSLIRTYLSENWSEIIDLVFDGTNSLWVSGFTRGAMTEFFRNQPAKVNQDTQTAIFFD